MKHLSHSRVFLLLCGGLTLLIAPRAWAQDKPRQQQPRRGLILNDRILQNDTITALVKPFQDVRVTPLAAGAFFDFETLAKTNPTVRIGKAAPTQQMLGRVPQLQWAFAPGDEVPAFVAPRPQTAQGTTTHSLRLQSVLNPNTAYFYILEAVSDGKLVQETGQFRTATVRHVKVVFQKIRVIKGGDNGSVGDTMFQFFVNYDATTNRNFVWLGGRETTLQIPDGGSVEANKEFVLANADELHLVVNGYDEDFLRVGGPPSAGENSVQVPYPLGDAGHNRAGAWNVAKVDIDLSGLPPVTLPTTSAFAFQSLPAANADGQDISFEVSGIYTLLPPTRNDATVTDAGIKNRGNIFGTLKTNGATSEIQGATATPLPKHGSIQIPRRIP